MNNETRDCSIKKGSRRWPGKCPLSPQNWSFLQQKYHLSSRELQVAICICSGCNNKQVAESLGVELNTAKLYIRNLYRRAGVNNKIMLLLNFLSDIS
jgi:DNA-binding NarL/FixJ family response regulator